MSRAHAPHDVLQRMVDAVEAVRDRLRRAARALTSAGVEYAIIGGNAVAAWVATIDRAAVRNTQDIDLLLRRADLGAAVRALESVGFVYRHAKGIDMFLDHAGASARDAVHIVFAGERVKPDYLLPAPDVTESQDVGAVRAVTLEALVRLKLTSFRRKDQVHLLDMLSVGLIDAAWVGRLPPPLGERLQHLIDTPDD